MTQLANVFKLNPKGLNVRQGRGRRGGHGGAADRLHVINQEVYYSVWRSGRCLWG